MADADATGNAAVDDVVSWLGAVKEFTDAVVDDVSWIGFVQDVEDAVASGTNVAALNTIAHGDVDADKPTMSETCTLGDI